MPKSHSALLRNVEFYHYTKLQSKAKVIAIFLFIAGIMYMVDTAAHFILANYQSYSSIFWQLLPFPVFLVRCPLQFGCWLKVEKTNNFLEIADLVLSNLFNIISAIFISTGTVFNL